MDRRAEQSTYTTMVILYFYVCLNEIGREI